MKYVVMKTGKYHAVVLSCGGEFIKIRNKNFTVGQEITLPKHNYSSMVAVAASFAIVFLFLFSGYRIYSIPEGYVSIDINPSIQLAANRFNRVIDIQSFNSDGKIVLEQSKVKHKSIEDSIERIIDISVSLGYLSEDNHNVVIDVVSGNNNTVEALQNKTEKYKDESIVIEIEQTDEEMLQLSKELGESVGRAKAIYDYTGSNGGDINENKKKLENESVAEIKNSGKPNRQESGNIEKQSKKEEDISKNSSDDRSENSNNNRTKNNTNNNKSKNSRFENSNKNDKFKNSSSEDSRFENSNKNNKSKNSSSEDSRFEN
ncbi:MAG TPA: hypothetical protein DD811_08535, partial [Syntrophomonas sp.]|nr:hypothetical protein [Syntrophomonas sp.]